MSAPRKPNRHGRLALVAAETRAREAIAARQAEHARADRAARLSHVRAALAHAEAIRAARPRVGVDVYRQARTLPPTLEARAAAARGGLDFHGIRRARERFAAGQRADLLAAVPDDASAYDWAPP